jgi:predicted Kef-type K+ transport protein
MAMLWGWSLGAGLVLGLALSVASTVVLLFNQWVPQLFGRPAQRGPLLPQFL